MARAGPDVGGAGRTAHSTRYTAHSGKVLIICFYLDTAMPLPNLIKKRRFYKGQNVANKCIKLSIVV